MSIGASVGLRPSVVLDTNAVLDWLVFADPCMATWAGLIEAGQLRWLGCSAMREELARTLGYAALANRRPDPDHVLARFDRWVVMCSAPPRVGQPALWCSDPDDQVFIDLAMAHKTMWLVSHDRALLRLARRCRVEGLRIVKPSEPPRLEQG